MFAAVVVLPTPPLDEHTARRMAGSVGSARRDGGTPCRPITGSRHTRRSVLRPPTRYGAPPSLMILDLRSPTDGYRTCGGHPCSAGWRGRTVVLPQSHPTGEER